MNNQLFESFREWVHLTRRRKDSKKPSGCYIFEGARVPCSGGNHRRAASGEIILGLEPIEFKLKPRSSEASWLNIKQLNEPLGLMPVSSSL
jgi:hypothetical protein